MKVANAVRQLKSELMRCDETLKTVLRLSCATGLVNMMNVNNWGRRCAHSSAKRPTVGLQSFWVVGGGRLHHKLTVFLIGRSSLQ